jgi:hypothetical protein
VNVYRLIVGRHECIVAADNQRAAAAAWGVPASVFAQGLAAEIVDRAMTFRATKTPGVVLRRLAGTNDRFRPIEVKR